MDPIIVAKWVKVIAYIVMLIAKGNSREGAVSMASTHLIYLNPKYGSMEVSDSLRYYQRMGVTYRFIDMMLSKVSPKDETIEQILPVYRYKAGKE